MEWTAWTAWTFRLKDKAYKDIRPLKMKLIKEYELSYERKWVFIVKSVKNYTGRWVIRLEYDRGPMTSKVREDTVFSTEQEARFWFDTVFTTVFMGSTPPPPPLKRRSKQKPDKKPHLKLL